jgi:hypothetical protein
MHCTRHGIRRDKLNRELTSLRVGDGDPAVIGAWKSQHLRIFFAKMLFSDLPQHVVELALYFQRALGDNLLRGPAD